MGGVIIDGYIIDGTHGGRRGIWRQSSRIAGQLISRERLTPVRLRLLGDERPIRIPIRFPGIPVPHLHYRGKLYPLTQAQWKRFSANVIVDLKRRLNNIKSVDLDRLSAMSAVLGTKR